MNEDIIKKLNLKESENFTAESFMYGLKHYVYNDLYSCIVGHIDGTPYKEGIITFFVKRKYIHVTEEFLLDQELEVIDLLLSEELKP